MKTMVTTVDNPHSPFDEFDAWYAYDLASGYHTLDFLGRILIVSDQLAEIDYDKAVELAVDEIVSENVLGIYRKVTKEI